MIDPSAFNLTVDTKLPPNKITAILNMLRQGVNKQYYATFSQKQQDFFQYFVWEVLHGLWAHHPSPTVRIAASTTVGQILMKLAPYFADQFLSTLTDAIEKTTNDSFLYLSSFCYLAKFTSIEKLSHILNNKPILHLFGPNNSEHLPDLVTEMKKCLNFPREFLRTVVELTLQLTYNNPTNRHFPKAASILIGDDIDEYASLIRSDISILLLDNLFPEKLPAFPKDQNETLISIKDRSINELKSENPQLSSYEASCKVLNKLVLSNQIENLSQEIKDAITEEMVKNSPNLPALLLLPIDPEIIKKMYTTQAIEDSSLNLNITSSNFNLNLNSNSNLNLSSSLNVNSNSNFDSKLSLNSFNYDSQSNLNLTAQDKKLYTISVECEKSKIIPLLTYFSSSITNIRMFFDELISLIYDNLCTTADAYSFALETLGKISGNLPEYVMTGLFSKALSTAVSSNNWIHKWWTLRMIGKINFTNLPSRMSTRAFDFIELAVISKSEKLKQTAKKVSVKLIDHCKHEEFKYFIDRFCRKFDLFDQTTFESRVSYLSYIFQHIPQNWTISFIHIATLLTEAIGLIKFSMNVMREIFIIIGVLSNNLEEPLVLLFAKQAQLIIDPSFREFCGEAMGIGQPPVFDREETTTNPLVFQTSSNYSSNTLINNLYKNATNITSSDNSINYIKNIGRSVLVSTFDTDLTSNPSLWHNDPLHYAEAAFEMLSKVQWSRFNLLFNDTIYFFNLAQKMIELFPEYSNALATSLIEAENISFYNVDVYIQKSIIASALHDTALFSFCKFVSLVSERFSGQENGFNFPQNEENQSNPQKPLFSLKSDKYNTKLITSTISLIFPYMRNVDFLNVLCVQNFMSLMNSDISDEICLKVVKPSQKHLVGSPNKNIDLNSASSANIEQDVVIDPTLLYQDNDDEQVDNQNDNHLKPTEFDTFDDEINGSPLAKNFGFLSFCSSLTPFYYLNIDVPQEMYRQEIILSFALYSTVKITEEQADKLIEITLVRGSPRILYWILKYCERMRIKINLEEKLTHPFFISKKVFLAVLPFLKDQKLPNSYISSVVGTDDLVSFVLNATNLVNRRASIAIIKFDAKYFMERFLKIEKIKYAQLYNLVIYASAVAFPANDFFSFAVHIIDMCSKSRKKKNLSRRLLSVFIGSNKTNKEIVINANSLLACEIIPLSNSSEIYNHFTAAEIIEYYYEIATISKTTNCTDVIEILCHVLSKNTIYGSLLNMIIHPQLTLENIQGMVSSPYASLQTLPFHYFDDKLRYDPNFSDMSPQIIDYLLQTTVIRTASTATTILSFLSRFLGFKYMTRGQMKDAFNFMHKNVDISPQCAALREVIMLYRSFLGFFYPKTQELKVVVDFADQLFDYAIVPTGSISILNQVSFILHDPSHVAVVLTPYLKMKDSYSMCYVCENAATYLLKVKMNRIERHSQTISKELKEQVEQSSTMQSQSQQKLPQSQSQQKLQQNPSQQKLQQNPSQQKLQQNPSQQKLQQNKQQQNQSPTKSPQKQQQNQSPTKSQQQQQPNQSPQKSPQKQQQQQNQSPSKFQRNPQQKTQKQQPQQQQQKPQQPNQQQPQKQPPKTMQRKQTKIKESKSLFDSKQTNLQLQSTHQSSQSQQSNLPLNATQDEFSSSSCYDESIDVIDDAVHVVSIARSFYATFCAVVAVENIRPTMKHDLLKGLFPQIYDYSLKILDDKDVKIFAPVFALLDENAEIPKELVDYIDATKEIVQSRKKQQ